jgi:hypothetical protein
MTVRVYGNMLPNRKNESYKTFKIHLTDTSQDIVPKVLDKYQIKDEVDVGHNALFLCYRGEGCCFFNLSELCLSFDLHVVEVIQRHIPSDVTPELIIKLIHKKDPFSPSGPPPASAFFQLVIQDYKPVSEKELKVTSGELVIVLERTPGWVSAVCNGRRGLIPVSCVSEPLSSIPKDSVRHILGIVHANYEKNAASELTVRKGEHINCLIYFQHWIFAETSNYMQGWIPGCYVSMQEPIHEQAFTTLVNVNCINYYRRVLAIQTTLGLHQT